MGRFRMVLAGFVFALLASGGVLAQKLPDALRDTARALGKSKDAKFVTDLNALLAADTNYRSAFSEEIADPATRKTALESIAAADAQLASSIAADLPEGVPDAAVLERALAPWFDSHVEAPLMELIEREVDGLRRSHAKHLKSLMDAVPALKANPLKKREKLVQEWSAARDETLAIILDETAYPDGNYTEKTQKPLDKKIRVVWLAHKKLAKSLDSDLAKLAKLDAAKWLARRDATDTAEAALANVTPALDGRLTVEPPDVDRGDPERMRRARGVVHVYTGTVAEGRKLLTDKGAYDAQLLARALALRSARHTAEVLAATHGPRLAIERDVARRIDEYRVAMGLLPLQYDERLQGCARGHSEEMRSRRYFGHDSPDPKRRTFEDRARLAGYPDPFVGEMIFQGSSKTEAKDVFMTWFYSALHHRLMLRDWWTQVGVARADEYFTLNFGKVSAIEGEPAQGLRKR